jgi:hypothetical protein
MSDKLHVTNGVHDTHNFGAPAPYPSPKHSQETDGDNFDHSEGHSHPLHLSSNIRKSSVSDRLQSDPPITPPASALSRYSAPPEKVFIYEEGKEDSLAQEISDYLDTADRSYDVEINIVNCFKPSATETIFSSLRDIGIESPKFSANYYIGKLQIVMVTPAHDKCSLLFISIWLSIIKKTADWASYLHPFDLNMYANIETFKDDNEIEIDKQFYGDHKIKSSEQGDHITKRPDDCICAGYSYALRLLQGQREIPLVTAEYGHSESNPGLDRDQHTLFAGTNCLIDLGFCIKISKAKIRLRIYEFSIYSLTKKLRSMLKSLQISGASSENARPLRDLIGTCFILVLFKILMELRDRHDLIGLLECRSVAGLNALKHSARSRLRPKWLVNSFEEDFTSMKRFQKVQKLYDGQIPAIRADIDDLLKLLAEIVNLSKSVQGIRRLFRSEVNRKVFAPLDRLGAGRLEPKISMGSLESSADKIFRAVELLDDKSQAGSRTYITLFIEMMKPTKEAEFKYVNGDASLQDASSIRIKLPARSLLGIGYWIPKSNAYELGNHESDRSFIQASKVEKVILDREDIEPAMTEIYDSIEGKTVFRSSSDSDSETENSTTQHAERHNDDAGNEGSDEESIISLT